MRGEEERTERGERETDRGGVQGEPEESVYDKRQDGGQGGDDGGVGGVHALDIPSLLEQRLLVLTDFYGHTHTHTHTHTLWI